MLRILHGDVSSHYCVFYIVSLNFIDVHRKLAKIGYKGNFCVYFFILQGLYIWVSKDAPQALIQKIFEVPHFGAIPEIMVCMK